MTSLSLGQGSLASLMTGMPEAPAAPSMRAAPEALAFADAATPSPAVKEVRTDTSASIQAVIAETDKAPAAPALPTVDELMAKLTLPLDERDLMNPATAAYLRTRDPLCALCIVAHARGDKNPYGKMSDLVGVEVKAAFPQMTTDAWNVVKDRCRAWLLDRLQTGVDDELTPLWRKQITPLSVASFASWTGPTSSDTNTSFEA